MKVSFFVPLMPTRVEQVLPFAGLAQWSRAGRMWFGQNLTVETHLVFAAAAAAGFRVPMGAGVTLTPLSHPFAAALQARSVAVASGHPFVAGFGPGSRDFQRSVLGAPYASPLTAVREYVEAVRALLAGEPMDHDGDYVSGHLRLPFVPAPPVEIGLGVLRPRMARLAGCVADVAITWLTPARYLRESVVPELCAGAAAAGRPRPRLVTVIPVCLAAPDREPAEIALAGSEPHLRASHYRDMLRRSRIDVDEHDLAATASRLVAGGGFLAGTVEELVSQATEFAEAGVDELVLNLSGVHSRYGTRATLAELATILSGF
ncbi:LLM class flavin-dependent oxidoreductase [Prauserella cavernicola]|uniref:LLM class flavin-dependent oxidoreductase n=1 Tax=Prauserella cavernicola TaxID=2800127 RepID=A0A934V6X1_9PSEU|nr:LLM class flavin-dependent oxidoreductase [Prauserella cavernicola]MBK1787977.1 LLM class flavin-dependent oxidoreductase [Prauserella cavernicola]